MKKILMTLAVGALLATTISSCSKKCGYCSTNGSSGPQYCNADNHIVYDAAVSSCTTGGGTWVKN